MKKIITLSAVAFLSTAVYANADLEKQVKDLSAKVNYLQKKVSDINKNTSNDNIKFDVDFRTSVDMLNYETNNGREYKNDGLLSNRLWLNMGYAPTNDMVFKGQLAYNKAFGNSAINPDSPNGYMQRGFGFDTFDWVSSETLNDDKVRVREAYWLWMPKVGDLSFTASVGRRPSTNGYLSNLREDDKKAKSPLGHVINMEFDGASAGVTANNILPGFMFKLCLGRGLTNAKSWANEADTTMVSGMGATSPNYIDDSRAMDTVDMAGFIFVPYDDGQYAVKTTWYRGKNVPGMTGTMTIDTDATTPSGLGLSAQDWGMNTMGDMDGMAISFKVDGIGDGINDFLDETTFFASYAMSKSHPDSNANPGMTMNFTGAAAGAFMGMPAANQQAMMGMMSTLTGKSVAALQNEFMTTGGMTSGSMMGSDESETGSSIWLGVNMPNLTGGRFGLEYNKGDEYWRPFTYGEDTMAGSKLATRGTAIEAYWSQPLISDAFSMQVRYTSIKYDYTGSNGFFGAGGSSYSMEDSKTLNQLFGMMNAGYDPVESAQDLRVYFRYRY
jgi:hypothetical protein